MKRTCYIVGAGRGLMPFERGEGDLIIAADGGYDTLLALGIVPDVLLGDFDSLRDARTVPTGVEIIRHPVKKDDTDTALAFRLGYERGFRDFVILGGTGGRSDHTLANYQLLLHARRLGAYAILVGEREITECLLVESRCFSGEAGKSVSVFAFGSDAHGVSIRGLAYEMHEGTLTADVPLGVSNAFLTDTAEIGVRDGALLVMRER